MQSLMPVPVRPGRTRLVLFVALPLGLAGVALLLGTLTGLVLAVSRTPAQTVGSNCNTSPAPAGAYTVSLCILSPRDGAVLRGTLPVRVSVSATGDDPGVEELTYSLDGQSLLVDYVYSGNFDLPTDHFGDGAHLFQVQVKMRDNFVSQPTGVVLLFDNGIFVSTPTLTATVPIAFAVSPAAAPSLTQTPAPVAPAFVPSRAPVRPYVPPASAQSVPPVSAGAVPSTDIPIPTPLPVMTDTPFPTDTPFATDTPYPTGVTTVTETPTGVASPTITPASCVGGIVGVVQAGSQKVANATLVLKDSANTFVIAAAVTDNQGMYQFPGLAMGTYMVVLTVPPGYSAASPAQATVVIGNCQSIQQDFTLVQVASPTSTATSTVAPSPTATRTATATPGQTRTAAPSPTASPTRSATATATASAAPSATVTGGAAVGPAADAYVSQSNPTINYGTAKALRVDGSPTNTAYLRFNVSVTGTLKSVKLNLFVNSTSRTGFDVSTVANTTWSETAITYNNAPAVATKPVGSSGPIAASGWVTIDLTAIVKANGLYSFALTTQSTGAISVASREAGANAPQLIIATGP